VRKKYTSPVISLANFPKLESRSSEGQFLTDTFFSSFYLSVYNIFIFMYVNILRLLVNRRRLLMV
jgi:hypothetical protein